MGLPIIVYSDKFLERTTPIDHPESPERIRLICDYIDRNLVIEPDPVEEDLIYKLHNPAYVDYVKALSRNGNGSISFETPVEEKTFDMARLSLGASLLVSDITLKFPGKPILGLIRPPGHHANRTHSSGFCIFNNMAIARNNLYDKGVTRSLIIDFDAHYGDGIADFIVGNKSSLYLTLDEDYISDEHMGFVDVHDNIFHLSLPPYSGAIYSDIFCNALYELFKRYKPEAAMCSMGFDGHFIDPLSRLNLTQEDYRRIGQIIAQHSSDIPIGFLLEGGYNAIQVYKGICNILSNWDSSFPYMKESFWMWKRYKSNDSETLIKRNAELKDEFMKALVGSF